MVRFLQNIKKPEDIVVGDGATKCYMSDRVPCTVVEVLSEGKTVIVQEDRAIRTDRNGISEDQTYVYTPCPAGIKEKYTLRKNGRYILMGTKAGQAGHHLEVGYREKYFDPHC